MSDEHRHDEPTLKDIFRLAETIRKEGQSREQLLYKILTELRHSSRRLFVSGVETIPRKQVQTVISTGSHFWDKVGLRFTVTPNGPLDSPPEWTVDPPDALSLTPSVDGLSCEAFADADVGAFTVTAQAPADNASTPELESVSESFTGSMSHSKATSLAGTFDEIPRP